MLHLHFFKKIKSNQGASIILALLILLICSTIGAVVLTAGTATVGRLTDIHEVDARYYSATSCVELLQYMIESENDIQFEKVRSRVKTVTTDIDNKSTGTYGEYSYNSEATCTLSEDNFLYDAALYAVMGTDTLGLSADNWETSRGSFPNISFNVTGDTKSPETCKVTLNMEAATGNITATVVAGEKETYTLTATFACTVKDSDIVEETHTSQIYDETTKITTDTYNVTETKTTTISWKLKSVS